MPVAVQAAYSTFGWFPTAYKLLDVSVGGSVVKSYGYDAAGRTTSVVSSAGTTTLGYDYEGRASSISGPGMVQANLYNGLDTRVGSTTNSVSQTYLRDGAYVTDPVLTDGSATYTPGTSERRGAVTTYLHSGLKNADAQGTTSQTIGATKVYDAFGNPLTTTGTWQGPFGYAGAFGYQEDATGLKLLGHRYYDASTGRFLTRDPVRDGRNWYIYCESDPISRVDPHGLSWIADQWNAVVDWWSGRDTTDGNGNPVRIGGFPRIINTRGNAETYNGTIHFTDRDSFDEYYRDPHWQNHEEAHLDQRFTLWRDGLSYLACWLIAALLEASGDVPRSQGGPLGHDSNPWEAFAEEAAWQKEGAY